MTLQTQLEEIRKRMFNGALYTPEYDAEKLKLLRAVEVMMGAIRKIDSDEYEESPYTITGEAIEKVEKIFGIKNDQR